MTNKPIITSPGVIAHNRQRDFLTHNLEKMMGMILMDVRMGRPKPLAIRMSPEALGSFLALLRSKSAYFPKDNGQIEFLGIPVIHGPRLPKYSFVVERIDPNKGRLLK